MNGDTKPLFRHQEDAVNFIINRNGSGAILHEMGLGKTRSALEIFFRLSAKSNFKLKMLIIAPISLLEAAWIEDVKKFYWNEGFEYQFRPWNIHDNDMPNEKDTEDHNIFLINYEMIIHREKEIIKMLKTGFWMAVLDESSKIKNYSAQSTKAILKLSKYFAYRIVMSGTPAPNSELEYWPQIQFVEPDRLGSSFTAFRSQYFQLQNRYSGAVYNGPVTSRAHAAELFRKCEYKITTKKREELMSKIMTISHMAKKKDCLDLPDMIDEVRKIEMNPAQLKQYKKMEQELVIWIKDQQIAAPVALTKIMKLRQITSGFVYNEFGEALDLNPNMNEYFTGDPPLAMDLGNEKIKELFNVIDEAGDQPILIWIQFHWELIKICHELYQKFGPNKVVTLSSMNKDRDGSISAFRDGNARFLVAHPRSAAHGLTFVNCALQIFFSMDYSLENYEQARARIHRAGQTKNCTYVHLIAKDSIDERIYNVLREKGDAQRIVYEIVNSMNK